MRRSILLILWLATDLAIFVAAYAFAYFLRVGWVFSSVFPFGPYIRTAVLVAPLWLGVLATTRTFVLTRNQRSPRNVAYILYSCVVGAALFALAYYFLYGLFFSRLLLLDALIFSTVGAWAAHLGWGWIARIAMHRSPPALPTLIIGITRESKALIRRLKQRRHPLCPVAILQSDGSHETSIEGVPVLGKLHKLEQTLQDFGITHVIQCSDLEQSLNLLSACRARGITYMLLPSVLGIVERDERIDTIDGYPTIIVEPKKHWLKWFFD